MHASRPEPVRAACASCGVPFDVLRSGAVVASEQGVLYACGERCRAAVSAALADAGADPADTGGSASWRAEGSQPPPEGPTEDTQIGARASGRGSAPSGVREARDHDAPRAPSLGRWAADVPWFEAAALAAGAVGAMLAPSVHAAAWVPTLASAAAAARALRLAWRGRADGRLHGVRASVGTLLVALGMSPWLAAPNAWGLLGLTLAAAVTLHRVWRDARSTRPLEALLGDVREALPVSGFAGRAASTFEGMSPLTAAPETPLRRGESVLVREGETLHVDGVVRSGAAVTTTHAFDAAPIARRPGDALPAGAHVLEGELRLQVTATGSARALAASVAEEEPREAGGLLSAPFQAFHAAYARWGGAAAVGIALLAGALGASAGLGAALVAIGGTLVMAPLLAADRATRAATLACTAAAGRRGIFFGSTRTLGTAGRIGTVILCPRGTVTGGVLEVAAVRPLGEETEETVLAYALGVEALLPEDAFVRALRKHGAETGTRAHPVRRAVLVPGRGATASTPQGETVVVGTRQLLLENGVSVATADSEAKVAEARGHSIVFVAAAGRARGVIALRDTVQPGAKAAVQRLMDVDADVVLLSGDHRGSLEVLAKHLAVDSVRAELAPDDRAAEVTRLRESGRGVAAVGRAGDDDETLGAADVAILLDGAGRLEAQRPGAIAIAGTDVRDAATALWMARALRVTSSRAAFATHVGGSALVFLVAANLMPLAVAAALTLVLDAYALRAPERLLERFARRVPEPT